MIAQEFGADNQFKVGLHIDLSSMCLRVSCFAGVEQGKRVASSTMKRCRAAGSAGAGSRMSGC